MSGLIFVCDKPNSPITDLVCNELDLEQEIVNAGCAYVFASEFSEEVAIGFLRAAVGVVEIPDSFRGERSWSELSSSSEKTKGRSRGSLRKRPVKKESGLWEIATSLAKAVNRSDALFRIDERASTLETKERFASWLSRVKRPAPFV